MLQFKHKKNEKNVQIVQREVRMKKLLYRPKDAWVGDLIPYYENGTFYGYYLHDPRIRDKEYAEETTWHLVTTKDFVNVEYKGEAIKRGGDDKPNKNAYTGSVIKDKENLYHAFFTAYNEDIKINGKSVQSVMQAVGTDLEHLNTVEEFLFVSDGKQYEEFDWRVHLYTGTKKMNVMTCFWLQELKEEVN